jgi:hypothetical protein
MRSMTIPWAPDVQDDDDHNHNNDVVLVVHGENPLEHPGENQGVYPHNASDDDDNGIVDDVEGHDSDDEIVNEQLEAEFFQRSVSKD